MKPSLALARAENREAIRRVVKSYRGLNPRVFGSTLRGTDREGSDLDLLIDRGPGMSLLDMGGIQYDLTELLGLDVNVNTPKCLPEKFRAEVVAAARAV